MSITIRRYGLEDAPEDNNDLYLCDDCAEDHGIHVLGENDRLNDEATYEGYPLFWLADPCLAEPIRCESCNCWSGTEGPDDPMNDYNSVFSPWHY